MIALSSVLKLWSWTPVLLPALLFLLVWAIWLGKKNEPKRGHWVSFALAAILLLLALGSPIAVLAENYLFSAHMLQHILLLMLIPPLLWLSIPERKTTPPAWMRWSRLPLASWLVGVGLMWIWHFPVLFNGAFSPTNGTVLCSGGLANLPLPGAWLHPLHLGLTLLGGLWFALPILAPWETVRLSPLRGIAFLVSACTACSVLGILITFAPANTYQGFGVLPDTLGIQHFLQTNWGLRPPVDQQIGGLLMWVPGCLIYLSGSMYLLYKWFNEKEKRSGVSQSIHLIKMTHYDQ